MAYGRQKLLLQLGALIGDLHLGFTGKLKLEWSRSKQVYNKTRTGLGL